MPFIILQHVKDNLEDVKQAMSVWKGHFIANEYLQKARLFSRTYSHKFFSEQHTLHPEQQCQSDVEFWFPQYRSGTTGTGSLPSIFHKRLHLSCWTSCYCCYWLRFRDKTSKKSSSNVPKMMITHYTIKAFMHLYQVLFDLNCQLSYNWFSFSFWLIFHGTRSLRHS